MEFLIGIPWDSILEYGQVTGSVMVSFKTNMFFVGLPF